MNLIKHLASSPTSLAEYLDSEDSGDLHDGTIKLALHGMKHPLADIAIVAAFLPADERDVILADIREAVLAWIERREYSEV